MKLLLTVVIAVTVHA